MEPTALYSCKGAICNGDKVLFDAMVNIFMENATVARLSFAIGWEARGSATSMMLAKMKPILATVSAHLTQGSL